MFLALVSGKRHCFIKKMNVFPKNLVSCCLTGKEILFLKFVVVDGVIVPALKITYSLGNEALENQ